MNARIAQGTTKLARAHLRLAMPSMQWATFLIAALRLLLETW
jgi:hypothetical protein